MTGKVRKLFARFYCSLPLFEANLMLFMCGYELKNEIIPTFMILISCKTVNGRKAFYSAQNISEKGFHLYIY